MGVSMKRLMIIAVALVAVAPVFAQNQPKMRTFAQQQTERKAAAQRQQAEKEARLQQRAEAKKLRVEAERLRWQAPTEVASVPTEVTTMIKPAKRRPGVIRAMEAGYADRVQGLSPETREQRLAALEGLEIEQPRAPRSEAEAAAFGGVSQGLVPLGKGREAYEGLEYTRAPRSTEYLDALTRGYGDVTSEMPDYRLQDLRAYKKLEREPIALPQMGEIGGAGLPYDTGIGRKYATWRTTPYGQYRFKGAHLPESEQYYTPTLTTEGAKRTAYGLASGLSSGVGSGLRGARRLGYEYGYQPAATGVGYVGSSIGSFAGGARRLGSEYIYQPAARKLGQAYAKLPSRETLGLPKDIGSPMLVMPGFENTQGSQMQASQQRTESESATAPSYWESAKAIPGKIGSYFPESVRSVSPAEVVGTHYMPSVSTAPATPSAAPVQSESTVAAPSYLPSWESIKAAPGKIWSYAPSVEGMKSIPGYLSSGAQSAWANRPRFGIEGERRNINSMSNREYWDLVNGLNPREREQFVEKFGLRPQ
jgi:hypothetical protein